MNSATLCCMERRHLVWMLNEIWPTVGWGSLEYGPPEGHTPGQVRGGRWKPLHYFYKQSLMTDVMATCGAGSKHGGLQCYVSNHRANKYVACCLLSAVCPPPSPADKTVTGYYCSNSTSPSLFFGVLSFCSAVRLVLFTRPRRVRSVRPALQQPCGALLPSR
jgi:hypothetical protein